MTNPPPTPVVVAAIAAGALVLGLFVFRPSRASALREWAASDHDQPAGAQPEPTGRPKAAKGSDAASVTELAWAKNCASCHGRAGAGDGPQGAAVKAPDLTRAEWQDGVSDADIAKTIRQGRNSMPAFDLPPSVIQGLVQRIRAARVKR